MGGKRQVRTQSRANWKQVGIRPGRSVQLEGQCENRSLSVVLWRSGHEKVCAVSIPRERTGGTHAYLDLTALGRQEAWEQPPGRATGKGAAAGSGDLRFHDEYDERDIDRRHS